MSEHNKEQISEDFRDIICVDFDATLATYEGWHVHGREPGPPIPGAIEAINKLAEKYRIWIYSARAWGGTMDGKVYEDQKSLIKEWCDKHGVKYEGITGSKIPAKLYICDRSIRFNGDWDATMKEVEEYEEWYLKDGSRHTKEKAEVMQEVPTLPST